MLGTEETEQVNTRIISATNKDLGEMVSKGHFREDLLHRINVIEINVPPLRQRPDDILPLAIHFLGIFCSKNHIRLKQLTPSAEAVLISHNWSGNVRELQGCIGSFGIIFWIRVVPRP